MFHLACLVKQQRAEIENDAAEMPRVFIATEQKKEGDDDYEKVPPPLDPLLGCLLHFCFGSFEPPSW